MCLTFTRLESTAFGGWDVLGCDDGRGGSVGGGGSGSEVSVQSDSW